VMLLAARWHIPEAITGGVAAVLIVLAAIHSWWVNKRERALAGSV